MLKLSIKTARKRGVPLIAVETADPAQTIRLVVGELQDCPAIVWDTAAGYKAVTPEGHNALHALTDSPEAIVNPTEALILLSKPAAPANLCAFFMNAHRYWEQADVVQAIWNLRDMFKAAQMTLIMLIILGARVPAELKDDVIVTTDELPSEAELRDIVSRIYDAANIEPGDEFNAVCAKLRGMSAFAAEQVLALSLVQRDGQRSVDIDMLEDRANRMIESTPGLSVYRGTESLETDVAGYINVKQFIGSLVDGDDYTIIFIDEIEKQLAGAAWGDTSGTSQDQLGVFLTWMQDANVLGILFIGPPGSGKSAVAKAAGNRPMHRRKVIQFDFGGMKDRFVGSSEQRIRSALNVINAVSQQKIICIATCNSLAVLPPELRRRFSFGIFYFPLPTQGERRMIWQMYVNRFGITADEPLPDDDGWTGAEIRNCCLIARKLNISLREAAQYIVPVSVSARDQIEKLESEADGRYISASSPGIYRRAGTVKQTKRTITD